MKKEELLTKEMEFEATVNISVHDLLESFDEAEKRALVQEMIDEISTEHDQDLVLLHPSLEDEYKSKHFKRIHSQYTLQEIEILLPDKKG